MGIIVLCNIRMCFVNFCVRECECVRVYVVCVYVEVCVFLLICCCCSMPLIYVIFKLSNVMSLAYCLIN